jgi:hypothetical protein
MPNDITDKVAQAKSVLAQANAAFPSPNRGHDAGVQFAATHKADPQGGTITGLMNQASGEKSGLDARAAAMKTLLPQ